MPERIGLILGLALLCLAEGALAHRVHHCWTSITSTPNSLEIVHRLHAHDAAQWLSKALKTEVDIADPVAQARFALHLESVFQLNINGQAVNPELLGAELKGNFLLIYQELANVDPVTQLNVSSSLLTDLFDDQVHVVDVRLPNGNNTLTLTRDKPASLTFPPLDNHARSH